MGALSLSSRAIIGEFFLRLEQNVGTAWIDNISMLFQSNQESETYKWLGMVPQMREWLGGRNAKGFRDNGITITNLEFEATLEVLTKELRRDKTGQVLLRIRELADRTNSHWAKLLSQLILNGESTNAYDGKFYFATDHEEGDSGVQSNDIEFNASTITKPTAAEMELAILEAVTQILSKVDNEKEPMNEGANSFGIMVPVPFMAAAMSALKNATIVDGSGSRTNTILSSGFSFDLWVNARLTWTTKFATFRTDGNAKPLIRQEEEAVKLDAIAEGSELEFNDKKHHYGVSATRNVGYGFWQHANLTTFT